MNEAGALFVGMVIPLIAPATEGAPKVSVSCHARHPHEPVEHVARLLHEHRQTRNTRRRRPGCSKQALLTPAHPRKDETFSQPGADHGMSQATAWQYADETLDVPADRAPGPHKALTVLGEGDHIIVDDTLIPIDRIRTDEPYHSTKHPKHGMNVQIIARPDGTPLRFPLAALGRTHGHRPGLPHQRDPRSRRPRPPGRRRHHPYPM